MQGQTTPAPLSDISVVDLSGSIPVLFAVDVLAELGARATTIERPPGPGGSLPLHGRAEARRRGLDPLYRHNELLALDLKSARGIAVARRLCAQADVVFDGFRPGVAARLGLGFADVVAGNDDVVYCSISAFGQAGPDAQRPGHDLTYLALSGLLSTTTRPGTPPGVPLNVVADLAAGGLRAATAVLAALRSPAPRPGGTYLDVSLHQGLLGLLSPLAVWELVGVPAGSWGEGFVTGAAPFYTSYQARDGTWVAIACVEPPFYAALRTTLGLDDSWADAPSDRERWPGLRRAIAAWVGQRTGARAEAELGEGGVPAARVRSVAEGFRDAAQRGLVDERWWTVPDPGSPPRSPRGGNMDPGRDTEAVLARLGYGPEQVAALTGGGAAFQAPPGAGAGDGPAHREGPPATTPEEGSA